MRPISIALCASLGLVAAACAAEPGYYGGPPAYYASADDNPYYNGAYWAYNDGGWYTGPTFEGTYSYVEPGRVPDYVNRHREHHAWARSVNHGDRGNWQSRRDSNFRGPSVNPSTPEGQERIGGTGQDQRG